MLEERFLGQFERRMRELDVPLEVTLWNGRTIAAREPTRVGVRLRSPKVISSLINPSMGKLARHYVESEIDISGDPRELVQVAEALSQSPTVPLGRSPVLRNWLRHSRPFDRKAIRHHYDVDDDFFGLWLDRRRVYSCAYFQRADDTLDTAQEQKLDYICRKLQLRPGERFLDIGCGWGALIMWAARNYRVRATGITLSANQYEYARRRIREEGLEDSCEAKLLDYRDMPEDNPFDKIASVGMFEHVGRKNLGLYFSKMYRLLKAGGLAMNHGITLSSMGQQELGSDIGKFIDEYVFPGGELVHISHVISEMSLPGFECFDVESLRPHYAKTLWHWVERLEANRDAALAKVGEKLFRIWHIYMAGSAHSFERGWLSVFQVLAAKPPAQGLLDVPLTRDYLYAG